MLMNSVVRMIADSWPTNFSAAAGAALMELQWTSTAVSLSTLVNACVYRAVANRSTAHVAQESACWRAPGPVLAPERCVAAGA